jgi:anaerobic selenocysteine-containing dehydrogenase
MERRHSFCRICESLCGLEVEVENNQIVSVKPDEQHIASAGFACMKGLNQHHMYASPDRLRHPMKRTGADWQRQSWEQTFSEIGAKVKQLRQDHGPNSIAMYVGTAAGFSFLHPVFAQGFMTGLGSNSIYASSTQDCSNKFAVAREMYGFPLLQPFPDLDRTECLIIVGANPVMSKWSFLQVSNPSKRLAELEARGGQLFVVDPRRTETAKAAGTHVFIRPDTDVFFFLAFLHELIKQGGVDQQRLEEFSSGFADVAALVAPWSPERVEEVTHIPAFTLRQMVTAYRTANGAALYSSTGVNMGSNGSLAFWLQECINMASGNLDKPGGTVVGKGILDFPGLTIKSGTLMSKARSRIGNYRATNDVFPGGLLADEILTPGDGQIKALFVTGGNPLITMPDSAKLREAFSQLELLVTLDIYRNETGSLAHYTLPATSPFERADLPFFFPMMLGIQDKPYIQATKAVIEPDGEQMDEASIYVELAKASGISLFGSSVAQGAVQLIKRVRPKHRFQETLLNTVLLASRQGSWGGLLKHKHGRKRKGHEAGDFLGKRVLTTDKKVQLAPEVLLEQAKKLDRDFINEKSLTGKFKLITKRSTNTHNSWTHNIAKMIERDDTNYLYLHPHDAAKLELAEGAMADVSTDTATVRVPVKFTSDLMPGVVALPHGWGHQHATGLGVASQTKGVNVNLLAASGVDALERVSGMAHLTGFVVTVQKASGEQDTRSWAGLSQ